MSAPILLVFLDGVGIGADDPGRNPFLRAELPVLAGLLDCGIPTLESPERLGPRVAAFPLDATLGVEGTPQSGTGQTSLLTGRNAARIFGRHFGPWTPVRLRPLLHSENLLKRAREAGLRVSFANAYPRGYPGSRSSRTVAAPPLAALAAGVLDRHVDELVRGDAVASEIVNTGWRVHLGHRSVPDISAREAGRNLASVARDHDLTLFAHYGTDLAGHRGGVAGAVAALERVDAFLGGVLEDLPSDALLVVASDHGNIEELAVEHTRNPALGLLVGPGARKRRKRLRTITDVVGALLDWLGAPAGVGGEGRAAGRP